jgi:hypothetical protein
VAASVSRARLEGSRKSPPETASGPRSTVTQIELGSVVTGTSCGIPDATSTRKALIPVKSDLEPVKSFPSCSRTLSIEVSCSR